MTIGELKKLIADVPDDYVVAAAGIEGPKVAPVSGAPEPRDREYVLHLESRRNPGFEVGTYTVPPRQ